MSCICKSGTYNYWWHKKEFETFEIVEKFRYGQTVQCPNCNTKYFINPDYFDYSEKIESESDIEFIRKWSNSNCQIKDSVLASIKPIDLIQLKGFNGINIHRQYLPCEVILKNGEKYQNILITFENNPPFWMKHYINSGAQITSINDVEEIQESEYKLSNEIIYETMNAKEVQMGCRPTVIKAPNGKQYTLFDTHYFFEADGIKGNKMKLSKADWRSGKTEYAKFSNLNGMVHGDLIKYTAHNTM